MVDSAVPENAEDSQETTDRLLIEEKRVIVLSWIDTLDKLDRLKSYSPKHAQYIDVWRVDYEKGIVRILDELVELGVHTDAPDPPDPPT